MDSRPGIKLHIVALPHLHKLRVSEGIPAVRILSYLEFPRNCLVSIQGDVQSPTDIEEISAAIRRAEMDQTKVHCVWQGKSPSKSKAHRRDLARGEELGYAIAGGDKEGARGTSGQSDACSVSWVARFSV